MKKRIIAAVCALSAMATTALPSVYAAETKPIGTSEITITTEVNGSGVVTRCEGDKITTNTYTASTPSETPKASAEMDKTDETEVSASESAIYNSYLFQLIKKFVFQCMDEYSAEHSNAAATPSPSPTIVPFPTVTPAATATPAPKQE